MKKTRNKFEERTLKHLKRAKVEFSYESERIPYTIYGTYTPDFYINGSWLLECKGHFRREDKRKLAAVKHCNPTLDIRILFYSYNARHIKWAVKHGFPYAIETIPTEWLC